MRDTYEIRSTQAISKTRVSLAHINCDSTGLLRIGNGTLSFNVHCLAQTIAKEKLSPGKMIR